MVVLLVVGEGAPVRCGFGEHKRRTRVKLPRGHEVVLLILEHRGDRVHSLCVRWPLASREHSPSARLRVDGVLLHTCIRVPCATLSACILTIVVIVARFVKLASSHRVEVLV